MSDISIVRTELETPENSNRKEFSYDVRGDDKFPSFIMSLIDDPSKKDIEKEADKLAEQYYKENKEKFYIKGL